MLRRSTLFTVLLALSLSSCRHLSEPSQETGGGWQYHASGTTSDLVIGQFLDSTLGFVAGQNGTVLKTTDGGKHWMKLGAVPVSFSSDHTVYGIHFFNENEGIAIGDGTSIWSTTNGGQSWWPTSMNTSYNFRCIAAASPNVLIAGTADPYATPPGMNGELWRSANAGVTWTRVKSISTGSFYNIQFLTASYGIATGKFDGAYYTEDAGITWNKATVDLADYQMTHTTFLNNTTGFACAMHINTTGAPPDYSAILRTDDAGKSWQSIATFPYGLQGISSAGNTITVAGFDGHVLESTDGGASWTPSSLGVDRWIDVTYLTSTRTMMIGAKGQIVTRDPRE